MNVGFVAPLAGLAVVSSASATFTGYVVTSTNVTSGANNLTVYTVAARFNGPTDTLLNAFNLRSTNGNASLVGFWHKDNASYNSGVLSQEFGTWNPSQTGSATLNRPFDSYVTIGSQALASNTSNADPSWVAGGNTDARSWNRADLPNNGTLGWFNSNPTNLAGRVGNSPGIPTTDVRIGQFVLSASDTALRTFSLEIGYNSGIAGAPVQFGIGTFNLGAVPAPGAVALLGLAGLAGRRRR
jgi:hypothetical protein